MMEPREIGVIGVPIEAGSRRRGACMGPDGYRAACLAEPLSELRHRVEDYGNLARPAPLAI